MSTTVIPSVADERPAYHVTGIAAATVSGHGLCSSQLHGSARVVFAEIYLPEVLVWAGLHAGTVSSNGFTELYGKPHPAAL